MMKNHLPDEQEREFSERFSRGIRVGRDEDERRAFRAYELIDKGLRTHEVPKVDTTALSHRMAEAMVQQRKSLAFSARLPRLAFVTA
ncbi:MAG: hypothetical protein ABIH23_32745, partial [bacterium]